MGSPNGTDMIHPSQFRNPPRVMIQNESRFKFKGNYWQFKRKKVAQGLDTCIRQQVQTIRPMNTLAEPSQLRLQVESHQNDEQDQDRKLILVSGEEFESFLRCYHKEE